MSYTKKADTHIDMCGNEVKDVALSSYTPPSPVEGMVRYDPTTHMIQMYDGTQWLPVGGLDPSGKIPTSRLYTIKEDLETYASDDLIPTSLLLKTELDKKTDIELAIWPWSVSRTYMKDSTTIFDSDIYVSLQDGNVGHRPDTSEDWWTLASGSRKTTLAASVTFGDAYNKLYVVSHGLGTTDVLWSLRTNDSDRRFVWADAHVVDGNSLLIDLAEPPGANGLTVCVIGIQAAGRVGSEVKAITFGNATNTDYAIVHGLDTYDLVWSLRTTSDGRCVWADVRASGSNELSVSLASPPGADGLRMSIVRVGGTAPPVPVDPHADVPSFPTSFVWTASNPSGIPRFAQTFASDGSAVIGELTQDPDTGYTQIVSKTSVAHSGTMVVGADSQVHSFASQTSFSIVHGLGKLMMVQVYSNGKLLTGCQITQDGTSVTVAFGKPCSGVVVLTEPTLTATFAPSTIWSQPHSLGRVAGVQCFDPTGREVGGGLYSVSGLAGAEFSLPQSGTMLML